MHNSRCTTSAEQQGTCNSTRVLPETAVAVSCTEPKMTQSNFERVCA